MLDKGRSCLELQNSGFDVPTTFDSIEEADTWSKSSGGSVFIRPYFEAGWDTSIFLPKMNSISSIGYPPSKSLQLLSSQHGDYLTSLHEEERLKPYFEAFGVEIDEVPTVSYLYQAEVTNHIHAGMPPMRAICMMNGDLLHVEWKSTILTTHSMAYDVNNSSFLHKSTYLRNLNNSLISDLIPLALQLNSHFDRYKNLQIEFVYGSILDNESKWYSVQVRDFPGMTQPIFVYNDQRERSEIPPVVRIGSNEDYHAEYQLHIHGEVLGSLDDFLISPRPRMKELKLTGRAAEYPLSHDMFSLMLLAHLHCGKVILDQENNF